MQVEKSSGKAEKITIKNESNRLSKEDIERMVSEAEKFKEDDERVKNRLESRNKLENYCYSLRSSVLDNDEMKKTLGDDMNTIDTVTQQTLDWLDEEGDGDRLSEDYETRMKDVEGQLMPLVQKAYQANMPTQQPPDVATTEPVVDEVD
jgi:molecular chaperone DnaK (HSP70)